MCRGRVTMGHLKITMGHLKVTKLQKNIVGPILWDTLYIQERFIIDCLRLVVTKVSHSPDLVSVGCWSVEEPSLGPPSPAAHN